MVLRRQLPDGVVERMQDRQLRVVDLPEKTMRHIARRRPEMDGCEMAIKAAVESAVDRCQGRKNGVPVENREILFAPHLGDGPWLAVVVAYEGDHGTVVTAYADRRGPREADRI
jgi:hypothetical protein